MTVKVCRLRDNLWEKMWTQCKESYEADKTATCMMHTLVQLLDDKSPAYDSHLDAENIRGLFVDLVAASISSTSSLLYALLNIWLHSPDILRRLQDETDRVMGKERAPSLFDRDDMHYASATILELLRYCNITPTVYHKALEDAEICSRRLPRGTGVIGLVNSVHLDDQFWKDPHAFRPERFLHGDGTLLSPEHPNRKHLMPFGAGPRLCVGEMFALRRMFAFVTSLAQAFDMEPGDNLVPCGYGSFEDGLVLSPRSFTIKLIPRMSFTRDPLTSDDD